MNRTRLAFASAFLALTACKSNAQKEDASQTLPLQGSCNPDSARRLEGKMTISDAEAKRLTGAKIVRQIKPGDPVTMDLSPDRLTIENDPASGRIVRASCG